MNISTDKESILAPLQKISGVVEKRQTLPILSNVLIAVQQGKLTLTGTDMEIEIQCNADINSEDEGSFTLPARKLLEIVKFLDDGSQVQLSIENDKALFTSGRSRFTLGVLPSEEFPLIAPTASKFSFKIEEAVLKRLLEKSQFAMAQQDVRYYLNGMLIEMRSDLLRTVATDGHRLALSDTQLEISNIDGHQQIILPRKAVIELNRLLSYSDNQIGVEITSNHLRTYLDGITLTSKLIDGRFPDYERVIPDNSTKQITLDKIQLKHALQRASILSNEKYRGIRFSFDNDLLQLQAHNPEQEVAEEDLVINYGYESLTIGFNVSYMLDVLNTLDGDEVVLNLHDENSSALIHGKDDLSSRYVVMPMRL